ncbi:MAG: hypothetical protein HY335_03970 [Deinococcus sp.]|nr:hypothetical protein [Deinococcus sp.]
MILRIWTCAGLLALALTSCPSPVGPVNLPAAGKLLLVLNFASGTVGGIDPATFAPAGLVPVGGAPAAIVMDGNLAYIALAGANQIIVLDTTTSGITARIPVGRNPTALAFDGTTLFTADFNPGSNGFPSSLSPFTLSRADAASAMAMSPFELPPLSRPAALALGPGGKLYVAAPGTDELLIVDQTTGNVDSTLALPDDDPLAVTADATRVFVATAGPVGSGTSGKLLVITGAPAAPVIADTVDLPAHISGPGALLFIGGNKLLTTVSSASDQPAPPVAVNRLLEIDVSVPGITRTVTLGPRPLGILQDGNTIYITNAGDGTVSVVDLVSFTETDVKPATPALDRVAVGAQPVALGLRP